MTAMTDQLAIVTGGIQKKSMEFTTQGENVFFTAPIELPEIMGFLSTVQVDANKLIMACWYGPTDKVYQLDLETESISLIATAPTLRGRCASGLCDFCCD